MKKILAIMLLPLTTLTFADTSPFQLDAGNSYYYSDHYEIEIASSPERIWPHLINLGSWMTDFTMAHHAGPKEAEGEVIRLYAGQDYFIEIVKIIPHELLLLVNLPTTSPEGEADVGVAMVTLTKTENTTVVSMFSTRKYSWLSENPNPVRAVRETQRFASNREITFNKFLDKLRELAED